MFPIEAKIWIKIKMPFPINGTESILIWMVGWTIKQIILLIIADSPVILLFFYKQNLHIDSSEPTFRAERDVCFLLKLVQFTAFELLREYFWHLPGSVKVRHCLQQSTAPGILRDRTRYLWACKSIAWEELLVYPFLSGWVEMGLSHLLS